LYTACTNLKRAKFHNKDSIKESKLFKFIKISAFLWNSSEIIKYK